MDNITEVVTGNLGRALEEVDKVLRSPRTRVEIITLRRQMKNVTSELGNRTLELYRAGRVTDAELAELCARIIGIEARITEREARLEVQAQAGQRGASAVEEVESSEVPCPRCNTPLAEEAVFCQKCGLRLGAATPPEELQEQFCVDCGRALRPESKFCPRCGRTV